MWYQTSMYMPLFYGNGIYCYNQDGKIVKSYTSKTSSLNNNYVLDIIEHKGQLWIATDGGGINILDMNSDQIKVMCHVAGDNFSLPVNSIVLLYEDRNGNLWAGSVRGGIFNIKKTYIRTYKDVALNNSNGLSDKSIIPYMKMTMTNYGLVQMEEVLIYMIHTPISLPIFLRPTETKWPLSPKYLKRS